MWASLLVVLFLILGIPMSWQCSRCSSKVSFGESIVQFALRYRTFIAEMRAEGIVLDDGEAAWFFKHKLGLSEVQKQMLETTLGAESEVYSVRERESVRLFKRLHMPSPSSLSAASTSLNISRRPFSARLGGKGSSWRKPGSTTSSVASSSPNFSRSSSTRMGLGSSAVNVAEQEPYIPEEVDYEPYESQALDNTEAHHDDMLQPLQDEIEALATELEAAAQDGCDQGELDALEEQLDGAVEALVTLREARSQIASVRKDRGFKGPSTDSGKGSSGKSRGNKAGHCFVCGQEGHWKGDQSCPGPPSSTKGDAKGKLTSALKHSKGGKDSSVQIAEHHEVHAVESSLHVPTVSSNIIDLLPEVEHVHDCFVAEHLSEALATFNQPCENTRAAWQLFFTART